MILYQCSMSSTTSIEYLSEWPPPPEDAHTQTDSAKPQGILKRPCLSNTSDHTKKLKTENNSEPHQCSAEHSLTNIDHNVLPTALLSRWWKRVNKEDFNLIASTKLRDLQTSSNPRTLLYYLARLPKGQAILTQRISFLETKLSLSHNSLDKWLIHYNIGCCYHQLGSDLHNTDLALYHTDRALQLQPGDGESEWLREQLLRQRDTEQEKIAKEERMGGGDLALTMPQPTEVERICASELSLERFLQQYALTQTPVVITDLVTQMTSTPWTLDYIKQRIGDRVAPLRRMVKGSVEWARLEAAGQCSVREFIQSLDNIQEKRYLFDWSLPLNCPELVSELSIPKYFANDFLQRTPEGSLYRDSWPSLFVAPAGVVSELHVDAFGSNFWMALFQGRKKWVFFPPKDVPLLYPVYANSTDAIFKADLSSPDLNRHPLLSSTHPCQVILGPGEVLYVPAGCPHRVENLESSLAISANFVDCSNFELVKKELRANGLVDEQAKQLVDVMRSDKFDAEIRDFQSSGSGAKMVGEAVTEQLENTLNTDANNFCVPWIKYKSQNTVSVKCPATNTRI